jgi:hypothetical protein
LHVADDIVLIGAIGIDGLGEKHILGLIEGATENAAATQALLDNLAERGLDSAVPAFSSSMAPRPCPRPSGQLSVGTRRSSAAKFTRRATLLGAVRRSTWPACARPCARLGRWMTRRRPSA